MSESDVVEFDLESDGAEWFTVAHTVHGEGRCIRQKAPAGYGHIRVVVSRHEGMKPFRFEWSVPEGMLPLPFMKAASLHGVKAALREPIAGGRRVRLVCVAIVDGSYHETDTTEQAVGLAAKLAVDDALAHAELVRT